MTTPLTTTDLDLLATCEETIARGLQTQPTLAVRKLPPGTVVTLTVK